MRHKYEFFYNWEYAQEHNPRLFRFGASGGFGCHRALMMKAVEGGAKEEAEKRFWILLRESLVEARLEEQIIGVGTLDEFMDVWFEHILEDAADESHFVREGVAGSTWQRMYAQFIDKDMAQ